MQENNLKGLWIPYEILTNEHLSDKEKYIYSLILFFSKNDGYCTITNKYIANIVNLSDVAFTNFSNTMNFIPSWHLKDRNSPTQDSRRYLGLLTFDQNFYTVYSVYGKKDDKYITSLYYDLKKEREIYNYIIFTNDREKILYNKKRFWI